jgi:drug/metabolite transporter (DMT)-like permease
MANPLFVAIMAGLGGMIGWGLADFFAKKTIDQIGDTVTLAWAHVFGTVTLIVFAFARDVGRNQSMSFLQPSYIVALLIFFGVLQAAVYFFIYKGFGKGQVAVLNPIFASFSGLVALISIFIFKEQMNGSLAIGLLLIFGGVLLMNIDFRALARRRVNFITVPGFREVAIATVLATCWTLGWNWFIKSQDWVSYTFFMYCFMTIAIIIIARAQKVHLFAVKSGSWKFLVLIGVCEVGAYLSISLGYSVTSHTSVIALLSGAFSLPTIILARMFLKEKTTRMQAIGSAVIIGGIMLLSLV